jgi:tetratricopeptide (TPR) repeat protein
VVHGTVRIAGPMMRVSAELVDGQTRETIWSKRFDRAPNDLFAVQDEISSAIVSAIEPVFLNREAAWAQANAAEGAGDGAGGAPSAADVRFSHWKHLMRARWLFWRSTQEHLAQCSEQLKLALAIKPDDCACLSLQAFVHLTRVWAGWSEDPRFELAEAQRLAMRAVRNDETDANAHFTLGTVLSCFMQVDRAITELRTALELYPQFAAAAGELGRLYAFNGQAEEAHEYALQAIDASPHDPHVSLWLRSRALAHFVNGEMAEACQFAEQAAAKRPDWFFNHFLVAACQSELGQDAKAQASLAEGLAYGAYSLQTLKVGHPFTRSADLERFVNALLRAGWDG